MSRVHVFLAISLDGYIAGPNNELTFLDEYVDIEDTFTPFISTIGCMLMGRTTYDVVAGMDVPWPYGEMPVVVATSRVLDPVVSTVQPVTGDIAELVAKAKDVAGDKDVYLDGGNLVRQSLEAGLVDLMTLSVVPKILGEGKSLFGNLQKPCSLVLLGQKELGLGLVELRYSAQQRN